MIITLLVQKTHRTSCIPKLLFFLFIFAATPLWADWNEEEAKINFLIDEVGQLEGVFIRNGKEHCPEEAVKHLRMKMEKAMKSWFATDKDQWTAELFIEKIASKSSMSGKLYKIKFNTGEIVNAGEWLHKRLKNFDKNS